jgi:hypothetical protein
MLDGGLRALAASRDSTARLPCVNDKLIRALTIRRNHRTQDGILRLPKGIA